MIFQSENNILVPYKIKTENENKHIKKQKDILLA